MLEKRTCTAVLALTLPLLVASAAYATDYERKVRVSAEIYEDFFTAEDEASNRVIAEAECVAVIPNMVKGALGIGGHHGKGVISCKGEDAWSPPAFVKMTGGSFGLQIGGEESDLVLFFMSRRGVESLLDTKFTLGAEAGVAAGPYGSSAEANTDLRLRAEIYAYAKSRGLFAGLSVEGASLSIDQKGIKSYYGERIWPEKILFEHEVPSVPAEAQHFMNTLPFERPGT